jgi:glycopeptide antibiotics resistance protein
MRTASRSTPERHHVGTRAPRIQTDERIARLAAIATIVAYLYGSLLPFDWRSPAALNPFVWLDQVRLISWGLISRTDLAVNVAIGLPLGFSLMGAVRTGPKRLSSALAALAVAGVSATLGTAVESLQVQSASRIGSWNDLLGQLLGVGIGILGWVITGAAIVRWVHALANERESLRLAAGVLQLYLPLYLLIQLTPLEDELAAKYGESRLSLLPVTHYFEFTFPVMRNIVGDALLSVPIGALSVLGWVGRGTHRRIARAMLLGGSIVVAVEIVHSVLWSHYVSLIDILSGGVGVAIGAVAALAWAHSHVPDVVPRWRLRLVLLLLVGWMLLLLGEYWYPFDFHFAPETTMGRLAHFPLIPFGSYYPSYSADPMHAVRELLSRFLLTIPFGALVRFALWRPGDGWLPGVFTTGVATILMLVIATGELFLPSGFPDTTEMVLGAMGAAVGCAVANAFARCRVPAKASSV